MLSAEIIDGLQQGVGAWERRQRLSLPHAQNDAVVTILAGAGGTDAQASERAPSARFQAMHRSGHCRCVRALANSADAAATCLASRPETGLGPDDVTNVRAMGGQGLARV